MNKKANDDLTNITHFKIVVLDDTSLYIYIKLLLRAILSDICGQVPFFLDEAEQAQLHQTSNWDVSSKQTTTIAHSPVPW